MSRGHWRTMSIDALPIDHAVAAGAADRRAGDLAAFGVGVLDGDVLGVQVDEPVDDPLQPGVRVLPGQVGVAGVEVDADRRRLDQVVDAVQPVGRLASTGRGTPGRS